MPPSARRSQSRACALSRDCSRPSRSPPPAQSFASRSKVRRRALTPSAPHARYRARRVETSEIAFVSRPHWRIRVGKRLTRRDGRASSAHRKAGSQRFGIDAGGATFISLSTSTGRASATTSQSPSSGGNTVRPVSRASIPTREVAAYAARAVLCSLARARRSRLLPRTSATARALNETLSRTA